MKKQVTLPITGMTCANCAATIERNLNKLEGVDSVAVNLANETAFVQFDPNLLSLQGIRERVKKAGYSVEPNRISLQYNRRLTPASIQSNLSSLDGILSAEPDLKLNSLSIEYIPTVLTEEELVKKLIALDILETEHHIIDKISAAEIREEEKQKQRFLLIFSLVFTIPLFILSMGVDFKLFPMEWAHQDWFLYLLMALATPVQFYAGAAFYKSAWNALRNKSANMDTLIAIGSTVAYFYSALVTFKLLPGHHYFETSAMIITLIRVGKFLEARAKGQASDAIKKLLQLQPELASVLRDGEEVRIPVENVQKDDVVVIRSGEKIPADGVIIQGSGIIDESMLTGESMPVEKGSDKPVFAATINKNGFFQFRVSHIGNETRLSRIIQTVEEAQGSKAPIQRLTDRIAAIFVPIILVIAALTFLVWFFLFPTAGDSAASFTRAMVNAVAVLVIACPCALGLATPTAIMVSSGIGASHGILYRNAEAIESGEHINTVILDKTGTVTHGSPTITAVEIHSTSYPEDYVLTVVASLEKASEHPLADAIVDYASERHLSLYEPDSVEILPGLGIKGKVDSHEVVVGNQALLQTLGVNLQQDLSQSTYRAATRLFIALDGALTASLYLSDPIKAESKTAVENLAKAGYEVHLLTGDNSNIAEAVGQEIGISQIHADVLPTDKSDWVKKLQANGNKVAMVGDGINDAPALAQADLGMAMGSGSDVAIASAPVTIMNSNPLSIPKALKLSRLTMGTIRQNLFWAFFYNIILIPIAALGYLSPILAAGAMSVSSLFVVGNSIRLNRRFK